MRRWNLRQRPSHRVAACICDSQGRRPRERRKGRRDSRMEFHQSCASQETAGWCAFHRCGAQVAQRQDTAQGGERQGEARREKGRTQIMKGSRSSDGSICQFSSFQKLCRCYVCSTADHHPVLYALGLPFQRQPPPTAWLPAVYAIRSASSNSFSTLNLESPWPNHSNNLLLSSDLSLLTGSFPSHPP